MGKITVKHYLNTDVSSSLIMDGKIFYPVYLKITSNRKTTKLRSFTKHTLTESQFENYLTKASDKSIENNSDNINFQLIKEINSVTMILDYYYNTKMESQTDYPMRLVLDFFLSDFDSVFFRTMLNNETVFTLDENEFWFMYSVIRPDVNIENVISFFNEELELDLYSIIDEYRAILMKGSVYFFQFLEKGKTHFYTRYIGKLIDWYCGKLRNEYQLFLESKKVDKNYFLAFSKFMDELEDGNKVRLKTLYPEPLDHIKL